MSKEQAIALGKVLWDIANRLRGAMNADEFRDYMLGFIFFKYLSENFVDSVKTIYGEDLENIYKLPEADIKLFEDDCKKKVGYIIHPQYLWAGFAQRAVHDSDILDNLSEAFKTVESSTLGQMSEDDMGGLFSEIDLNSVKIGRGYGERNKLICGIIRTIDEKLSAHNIDRDELGDAYEYLIAEFAANSGKKAGEFYTPQQVSTILSRIVTLDFNGKSVSVKKHLGSIYDPTCGSGSLLFNVAKQIAKNGGEVTSLYGQEKNLTTYNLARMNLLLHRIPFSKFHLHHGDTLTHPNVDKNAKFEAVVANPPFSLKWDSSSAANDDRFKGFAIPPQGTADFAFILHMLHHLDDNGTCAVVVPHGVLFRSGAEQKIRETLLNSGDKGWLDAVIGLPGNLFYSTGIPVCILVFKKCRIHDNVLFIDAGKEFEKEKKQNVLSEAHIDKIVDTYAKREAVEKYSSLVSLGQIKENGYNLNITRYVDSSETEKELDISEIVANIKAANAKLEANYKVIKALCDQLGVECW